jgi:hypothetical protein
MFTRINEEFRQRLGAFAAVCVVAIAGLAFEFGHAGALPAGTVEIGDLQPVNLEQLAEVTLPGIVVTAERLPVEAPTRDLPGQETRLAANGSADRNTAG